MRVFILSLVLLLAACTIAPPAALPPTANPNADQPAQAPQAAAATLALPRTPTATRTATSLPTQTPSATPLPSLTPTLTPLPIPFDPISHENAGQIKPLAMLTFDPDEHPLQMAFSQDGGILTTVSQTQVRFKDREGMVVRARNAGTGEVLQQFQVPSEGLLHPDGLQFIAYHESKLYLYDVLSGQVTSEQVVGSLQPSKMLLSPDGSYLVISRDNQGPEIWDLKRGASAFKPAEITYTHDMAFSQDGSTLAILVFYEVFIYHLETGTQIAKFFVRPRADYDLLIIGDIALSPDGSLIAIDASFDTHPAFALWDARSGEPVAVWSTRYTKPGSRSQVAFSPDGNWVATAALDKVYLFDGKTGIQQPVLNGTLPLAFSPDSRFISTATEQGDILLWSLETGAMLVSLRGHTQKADAVSFHPAGKLLASRQYNASVGLWGVPSAGITIARAGVSMSRGLSSLSDTIPAAWRASGGKPARYHIDLTLESVLHKSCPYTGNHTLYLKLYNENVVLTDLETNTVIARQTFRGQPDPNSPGCPLERTFNTQTAEEFISIPDYEGFSLWLETTLAPLGFVP